MIVKCHLCGKDYDTESEGVVKTKDYVFCRNCHKDYEEVFNEVVRKAEEEYRRAEKRYQKRIGRASKDAYAILVKQKVRAGLL